MNNDIMSVKLRSGNDEAVLQGTPGLIAKVLQILGFEEGNYEVIEPGTTSAITVVQNGNGMDFPTFFRGVNPANQNDQVLLITYYYQKIKGLESLSLEEYDEAFKALAVIPIDAPANLKSSVRNVVDRTKYLRNSERGRFALTMTGQEHIESIIRNAG
jgi:hypothetical protein